MTGLQYDVFQSVSKWLVWLLSDRLCYRPAKLVQLVKKVTATYIIYTQKYSSWYRTRLKTKMCAKFTPSESTGDIRSGAQNFIKWRSISNKSKPSMCVCVQDPCPLRSGSLKSVSKVNWLIVCDLRKKKTWWNENWISVLYLSQ